MSGHLEQIGGGEDIDWRLTVPGDLGFQMDIAAHGGTVFEVTDPMSPGDQLQVFVGAHDTSILQTESGEEGGSQTTVWAGEVLGRFIHRWGLLGPKSRLRTDNKHHWARPGDELVVSIGQEVTFYPITSVHHHRNYNL